MRIAMITAAILCLAPGGAAADDWQATTAELVRREKPGYGGVSGVVVDRASGDVFINLSDRGVFRSADQGRTWQRHGSAIKGRTETPGCLQIDPTGKSNRLVLPTVYGGPIALGATKTADWRLLNAKSTHVDWCAVDWTDADLRFVLALKHESGGLLLVSRDGGQTFAEAGKGYGPAWVFNADTAVVALAKGKDSPKGGMVRTTDGGRTFQPTADYAPLALPRWHGDALYWLVAGALVKTTDQGATWKKVCDLKDPRFGPVFGKDARHLWVLTGAGVIESTDAGQTWSPPIAPPRELKGINPLTWLDYDPNGGVLYLMKMGSDLYKLAEKVR